MYVILKDDLANVYFILPFIVLNYWVSLVTPFVDIL